MIRKLDALKIAKAIFQSRATFATEKLFSHD